MTSILVLSSCKGGSSVQFYLFIVLKVMEMASLSFFLPVVKIPAVAGIFYLGDI